MVNILTYYIQLDIKFLDELVSCIFSFYFFFLRILIHIYSLYFNSVKTRHTHAYYTMRIVKEISSFYCIDQQFI